MFNGIGWLSYIKYIMAAIVSYYLAIGWIYRQELLQWWRERKK